MQTPMPRCLHHRHAALVAQNRRFSSIFRKTPLRVRPDKAFMWDIHKSKNRAYCAICKDLHPYERKMVVTT